MAIPPNTISSPFGYVSPLDNTARVVYVGADNHVHELRLPPGQGWFDADLSALANSSTTSSSDPRAYVLSLDKTPRVIYRGGDGHIHELRLPPGQGWFDADLSALAGSQTTPSGDPFAYGTPLDNTGRVIYKGADGHIHELSLPPNSGWSDADLSKLAVAGRLEGTPTVAAGVPSGYVTPDNTARVVYRSSDEHIHELRLPPGQGWADADLSALGKGAAASPTDPSDPFGYVTPDNTARVVYRGGDGHIHELSLPQGGSWSDGDLSKLGGSSTTSITNPFGYVTPDKTARVIYAGADGHIHELSLPSGGYWSDGDLSALGGGPAVAPTGASPRAYVTPADNVPRVVYHAADNHVHELRLQPNWIDADLTILAASEQTELDFSYNPIVFGGGVPVGGWSTLTLHSDGSYIYSGHFHDSGATEYNMALAWAVADSHNNVYTFQHNTGKVAGTFEPGSRDDDWTVTGQNDAIAQNWGSLVIANFWKAQANASGDLTNLLNSLISAVGSALGVVGLVIAVV